MFNHSVPRSVVSDMDIEDNRAVLRVRNIRESAVYHLTFDGDIGRLTGFQLRSHIKSICGAPVEQQILTYNGQPVPNECTGYEVGLRPGAMIILDFVARPSSQPNQGSAYGSRARPEQSQLVRGSSEAPTNTNAYPQPIASHNNSNINHNTAPVTHQSRFEAEISTNDTLGMMRRQDNLQRSQQSRITYPTFGPSGVYDDVEVEVEIEEETAVEPWAPTTSVEAEEARLLAQDYTWKMEQVRFETERMHREREMMRQRQELEYQAELLERERLELERKTRAEKLKLAMMHDAMHEEMSIQAQISSYHEVPQSFSRYQ